MKIEDTDLSNAHVGLFYRQLMQRDPNTDSIAADDLATGRHGESAYTIRRQLNDLEGAGYLVRWQEGLGNRRGTRTRWQCYPDGDAPRERGQR